MKETAANPGFKKCDNDVLIREFTLSMVGRLEDDEQRIKDIDNVRTKVRTVDRLLKQLQHDNQTCDPLSTFICGQRYKKVCEATKRLALHTTDSPQIAFVLGNYIKHLALLKISMGICNGDADEQSEGRDFQFLFQAHLTDQVSCVAKRRQRLRKLSKSEKLPDTEDLVMLRIYRKGNSRYM